MKNIGIIAEYNPFHNGHKYQLDYAKSQLGADYITVAMSGAFTQRGEIAITDKYTRANMALCEGVDLVLEIPAIFATSSAKDFANCAVALLANAGVTDLLFGIEDCSEEEIIAIAKALCDRKNSMIIEEAIFENIKKGMNFALARAQAAASVLTPRQSEQMAMPNNILAIEYISCILTEGYEINIHALPRCDKGYHSNDVLEGFASASFIRNELLNKNSVEAYIPPKAYEIFKESTPLFADEVSLLLHDKLFHDNDFYAYLDCTEDLSNKIMNTRNDYVRFSQYCELLKSKNYSYTRISRVLCHILITADTYLAETLRDFGYLSYIRILGATEKGLSLLKNISEISEYPILTSPDQTELDDYGAASLMVDCTAYEISRFLQINKTGANLPVEKSRKFLKV